MFLVSSPHSLFAFFALLALFASFLSTVFVYVAKPFAATTCIGRNFFPAASVNDPPPIGHGVTSRWSRYDHLTKAFQKRRVKRCFAEKKAL